MQLLIDDIHLAQNEQIAMDDQTSKAKPTNEKRARQQAGVESRNARRCEQGRSDAATIVTDKKLVSSMIRSQNSTQKHKGFT